MNKLTTFIKASYGELVYKVSWPKLSQLQSSAALVLLASLIFALLIGLMDQGFKTIMDWFYQAF